MIDKPEKKPKILKNNKDMEKNKNKTQPFRSFIVPPRFNYKIEEAEEALKNLSGILFAKIVLSEEDGDIKEIHIIAKGSSDPARIIRDLESFFLTKYNIGVDYRKISIAQVKNLEEMEEIKDNLEKHNTVFEIKKEIKEINQKIVSLDNNIKELIKKDTDQKIDKIEFKIDLLSYSNTKVLSSLREVSASVKGLAGYNLPIPYIISLSLSTGVSIFCGTSLIVNMLTKQIFFDSYLSLFWFLGGIGIGLMSLKGIFDWSNK